MTSLDNHWLLWLIPVYVEVFLSLCKEALENIATRDNWDRLRLLFFYPFKAYHEYQQISRSDVQNCVCFQGLR